MLCWTKFVYLGRRWYQIDRTASGTTAIQMRWNLLKSLFLLVYCAALHLASATCAYGSLLLPVILCDIYIWFGIWRAEEEQPPSTDEGNVPSQPSTEAGTCLDLSFTSTGQVGQVGCDFVLKKVSSSWSGNEFAIPLEDAHWDFHKIQGFIVLRGSNLLFSQLIIFFQCPNPSSSCRSSSKDESMTTISSV